MDSEQCKRRKRKGKVQLINASSKNFYKKRRKPLGSKRNELTLSHIIEIQDIYSNFEENEYSRIFDNEDFGFYQITTYQPEIDERGNIIKDSKGKPKSNKDLKDSENVPLKENIKDYFAREVLPYAENAWYDKKNMKIGYEIPFNKYFYKYEALRPLDKIAKDIFSLEEQTDNLLQEIVE